MKRFVPVFILCRRFFTGTILAYLVVSCSLGGAHAARPVFYAFTLGWLICLCSRRMGRVAPSRTGPDSNPRGRAIRSLEVLGFNVALTLVVAEFSLRVLAFLSGSSFLAGASLDAYRLTPGRDYGGGLRGNRLGYPGEEFRQEKRADVYRIVALGDSFAVGPAVPFADNYLTLIQADLRSPDLTSLSPFRTEVYNFGVSGAGPREYYTILKEHALAFQPDLVLVSLFVGNDITESLATPRGLDPRRHYLYLLFDRGLRLLKERWRRGDEGQRSIEDRLTAGALAPATFREVEARRLAVCLDPEPPGLERKWQRALGYLDRIVTDCQRQHVPVACVLIPDEFQVNPNVLADALQGTQTDVHSVDLERPQRRLLAFFAERRVPCLDLLPTFQEVPNTYQPRDTHWNVHGNRLAAETIGHWLLHTSPTR